MKLFFVFMNLFLCVEIIEAQVAEPVGSNTEQQLENITLNNEDNETEDDTYLQQLEQYRTNPVELNYADEYELKQLRLLTPLQVHHFMIYRNQTGKLIDIYELQAVPGWDIGTIQKLRPYITVSIHTPAKVTVTQRLKNGRHRILFRAVQVLERAAGYLPDSSAATGHYSGSPQKYLLRYTCRYRNLLQYGIVAEKDAGESFFRSEQKQGFDFYSAHIFLRKIGLVKAMAIGDFTVNLGQGLTHWQGLAFKKSADVMQIKREAEVLQPYHAAGEVNFHRGLGITLARKNLQLSLFGSFRNLDANRVTDTTPPGKDFITSLQTSGFHRTQNESNDKGIQRQLAFGGNLAYRYRRLHLGINAVWYRFTLPFRKPAYPYNRYALSGNSFGNYSVDYSYTFKNWHFFGEAAFASGGGMAFTQGLLASVAPQVDLGILYRNISAAYQSLYSNAFTESAYPSNEKGVYAGISIRPGNAWRIDAYADVYAFPWLRYRVDAPSYGKDYLLHLNYKPGKQLEIYARYRFEAKAINANLVQLATSPVIQKNKKSLRTQVNYRINTAISIRNRTEMVWYDTKGTAAEKGFLIYFDLLYKPLFSPFSGSIRLQYFETEGYNSRIYAYENDILYSFSIPVFYDKGHRYYININYDLNKRLSFWLRWAQTVYPGKSLIGSGLEAIKGNKKSEIKLQVMLKF